ncbi:HD-domain/PDEase-like protein [Hesseltinella vesiculosa]|uniref:HD-domain/PDEase-like protein n=1 Tax=Hesseltinella vesiculosa TaxID=101127 RepID=A0A1X2GWV3_9FUNG|nr:HD-domain/PDEase-like protein [Hesseltinella vesiculosa]
MDPSHCSVVILQQDPPPFILEDNDVSPAYLPLLKPVFAQVSITSDKAEALTWIKEQPSTLLLLDLNDETTDDSLTNFANTTWITTLAQQIDDDNVPIIVCSSVDHPSFMLDCIHAGATDYILKPIQLDVVKTLFLSLHRHRSKIHQSSTPTLSSDHVISPATTATTTATTPITPTHYSDMQDHQIHSCAGLRHRIKDFAQKDTMFAKTVLEIYAPAPAAAIDMSLSREHAKRLQDNVDRWDFSPFDMNHQDLVHCVILMFRPLLACPDLEHLMLTQEQLYDFINDLSNVYHGDNPYHNFAHAVDVLQCTYYIICQLGLFPGIGIRHPMKQRPQDLLRPIDLLALFIAAIGHDAAHPGVNNLFLVNSSTPLALVYNDRSVLESFHSMTLFQLMKKHRLDQIGDASTTNYQEFRKTVVTSILATDMSLHNDYVAKFKEQTARFRTSHSALDEDQERLLLCSAIIKCADISNVARPFIQAKRWAELLVEEFACQGDLEKAMGMPVSPVNDRDKVVLEDSQIGFIRFVAMGLFQQVRETMPDMGFAVDQMDSNISQWQVYKTHQHDTPPTTTHPDKTGASSPDGTAPLSHHEETPTSNEALLQRMSMEATSNDLGGMPAMAMTDYRAKFEDDLSLSQFPSTQQPPGWHDGPVYCQCTIQ